MSFKELLADVDSVVEEVLFEDAELRDSRRKKTVRGAFRKEFSEYLSEKYGFTDQAVTFECAEAQLAGINKSDKGDKLKLTFDNSCYTVMDIRPSNHNFVLLVLQ